MNHLLRRVVVLAGACSMPLALLVPSSAAAAPVAVPQLVPVGAAPAIPAGSTALGALADSTVLSVTVTLQPTNPDALNALAQAVSTPGSSSFRQYLSAAQFAAEFGPSQAEVAMVESALEAAGLQPGTVSSNHLAIPVVATTAQLAHAFQTGFNSYRLASGQTAYANTSAPVLAATAAPYVQGVIGLDDLQTPHRLNTAANVASPAGADTASVPHVVTGGPQPCSAATSAGSSQDSFTADQLASAYRFSSLYGAGDLGSGQTIGLYELEPNLTTDISAYQSCYGTSASVSYVKVDSGAGTGAGEGEAALDIEDVIGLAPKANVIVYQGPNTNSGAYDTYNSIIGSDTAKVVSTSWGLCESSEGSSAASSENTLFQEAATQGQTIVSAAGDSGSEDCGTNSLAVDDPASQPYITGVGGTTLTAIGPSPTEKVWNEKSNGAGAGGGGISTLWSMPSYQSGAPSTLNVINSSSSGTQCKAASGSYCREVPDVSADADPYSGYVVYYDGSWGGIGGTSAAAPLWAAFTALTNASTTCAGKNIGFANPVLYKAAASGYSSDFQDITSGNNDYTGTNSGKFTAGTGFDMASGLGTPDGAGLPAALCGGGGTTGNTVTVTNPGSETGTVGTAVSLQIKATDSASGQTLTYSATGLPTSLGISSSTGLITGTPSAAGAFTTVVTATDTTGAKGSASFTWTISAAGCSGQLLVNPGFESGSTGWTASSGVIQTNGTYAHAGKGYAWLDGYGAAHTDTLSQKVTIPAGCPATLTYWLWISSSQAKTPVDATLTLAANGTTIQSFSQANQSSGYVQEHVNVSAYAGQTVTFLWTGVEIAKLRGNTSFFIDDTALTL